MKATMLRTTLLVALAVAGSLAALAGPAHALKIKGSSTETRLQVKEAEQDVNLVVRSPKSGRSVLPLIDAGEGVAYLEAGATGEGASQEECDSHAALLNGIEGQIVAALAIGDDEWLFEAAGAHGQAHDDAVDAGCFIVYRSRPPAKPELGLVEGNGVAFELWTRRDRLRFDTAQRDVDLILRPTKGRIGLKRYRFALPLSDAGETVAYLEAGATGQGATPEECDAGIRAARSWTEYAISQIGVDAEEFRSAKNNAKAMLEATEQKGCFIVYKVGPPPPPPPPPPTTDPEPPTDEPEPEPPPVIG